MKLRDGGGGVVNSLPIPPEYGLRSSGKVVCFPVLVDFTKVSSAREGDQTPVELYVYWSSGCH